jgi:hypothetical protein
VTVSFGGTVTIPASVARLDFLSRSRTGAIGWKPKFKPAPFKADAFVEAKASAFVSAALGLEISAIGGSALAQRRVTQLKLLQRLGLLRKCPQNYLLSLQR